MVSKIRVILKRPNVKADLETYFNFEVLAVGNFFNGVKVIDER